MTQTSMASRQSDAGKAAGDRAVNFFCRRLVLVKGRPIPFVPTPDQAAFLRAVFGTLRPDGKRQYRTIYRELPKKNSKTSDAAGCLLKCLFDEEEYGGEVYSAAATRDQAGRMFGIMESSLRRSPALYPTFRGKPVKLYPRDKRIWVEALDAFYQALSSDANYEDGINPSAAAVDELHRHKSRDLLDVIQEGMGAREQPLLFILTTAGAAQAGPAWDMHCYAQAVLEGVVSDPTFFAQIYAAGDDEDWESEETWRRCNPMLEAGILDIEDFRRAHRQAQRIPSAKRAFLRLRLNRWIAVDESWLPGDLWDACGADVLPATWERDWAGRECFGGLDLSSTSDFTAWVLLFPRDDGGFDVVPRFFIPTGGLEQRGMMRDDIAMWGAAGFINLVKRDAIDYALVADQIRKDCQRFNIVEIGYDPWHAVNVINLLDDVPVTMVKVSQYASVMNAPCRMLETLLAQRNLHHYGNPVLRWMARNVYVELNPYDAMRPSKRRSKDKIDGITALLIALERAAAPRASAGIAMYISGEEDETEQKMLA